MARGPLAYFITFTTCGTWLPGDERGSVDEEHNVPGLPYVPTNPVLESHARSAMTQEPYLLDAPRRRAVLQGIVARCSRRGWPLLALHVRTNHVHVVVASDQDPDRVLNALRSAAGRRLNLLGADPPGRLHWTEGGSKRYLWTEEQVA